MGSWVYSKKNLYNVVKTITQTSPLNMISMRGMG